MKIIIKVKNVYGNELVYPVCETAKNLARLTNKKTLSLNDLEVIKQLGYKITLENPLTIFNNIKVNLN